MDKKRNLMPSGEVRSFEKMDDYGKYLYLSHAHGMKISTGSGEPPTADTMRDMHKRHHNDPTNKLHGHYE